MTISWKQKPTVSKKVNSVERGPVVELRNASKFYGDICVVDQISLDIGEGEFFSDYLDWRAEHPSDDLMTELLFAEFEDEKGTKRRLTGSRCSP